MRARCLLALPLLAACSTDPGSSAGGQGDGGVVDGAAPDGGVGDGGEVPGAILSSPVEPRYTCTASQAIHTVHPPYWSGGQGLSARGERFYLARIQGAGLIGPQTEHTLLVSEIAPRGASDPVAVRQARPNDGNELDLAAFATTPEGWMVVYLFGAEIRVAWYDGVDLTDTALAPRAPLIRGFALSPRGGGGWWLAWSARDGGSQPPALMLVGIDAGGGPEGPPRTLRVGQSDDWDLLIASAPGALAWASLSSEGWKLELATLDDAGRLGAAQDIARYSGIGAIFGERRPALLRLGDTLVASWAETTERDVPGTSDPRQTVVWLARFDLSGALLEAPRPLMEGAESVENIEPQLFEIHGELGVSWAQGSVIYTCSGCMPDEDLRMVILAKEDLHPLSEVLALPYDEQGGLLSHHAAAAGARVAIATHVQHHVPFDPALGFVTCQ